ncbi:DUF2631 domain-containing protein [Mycobacterium sp. MYCO198283]|uniref:DUF2631 domain-containing protein n=1 Tax=Mycobacterium sp. MYCO198283 TaxID=2883505 RepID=UPI001E3EC51A|nr:DUF2631 domain-containing protein [Mycobacterium sp. MYCO198283]MCG5433760.1 DUF2631 domain-containing protein [Mycobacterium sp. MYCO198283]
MPSTEVQRHTGVDPVEVPSAEWGWSDISPRVWHVAGILGAVFLLLMLRGNHTGKVEDLFLVGFAVAIVVLVVRNWWLRRRGWIR